MSFKNQVTKKGFDETVNSFIHNYIQIINENKIMLGGNEVDVNSLDVTNVDKHDYPDFADAYIISGKFVNGTDLTDAELEELNDTQPELLNDLAYKKYNNVQQNVQSSTRDRIEDKKIDKAENVQQIIDQPNNRINTDMLNDYL